MHSRSSQVLIVGAGPIGLTMALDLASRGIEVTVLEKRAAGEPPSVKCNHVSARSMEIFRRLGVVAAIRAGGLPDDYPHDVAYRTAATGIELTRITIPGRAGRERHENGVDADWPTPEPPHRINQIYLEPILFQHARAMVNVTIVNRIEATDLRQNADGVQVMARGLDDGVTHAFEARYLIGCDGGRSWVRKKIGAKLIGDAVVQRVQSTYIRAPGLIALFKYKPAWATFALNPRRSGNTYAIDGHERWLVHNYLRDDEEDFESVDRDQSIRDILGVDYSFKYEIISKEDWFGRRLVANRFRDGRVFLCGDSAHVWVPYAGYGMNAGIADAANLAWLLAARLNGWGGPSILDAYEAERLPITEQVSHFAMNHAIAMAKQRGSVPANIETSGPEGDRLRTQLGQRAYELNVQQYSAAGLNFGYFYDRSPLIAYDGETAPAYSMGTFTESTAPGCRVPHITRAGGGSLYDDMGPDYALLRFDRSIDPAPLIDASRQRAVPMRVVDLAPDEHRAPYSHALVLARPDQHVAWRGDAIPPNPLELIDLVRGGA